jgi:hypothetical protein
MPTAQKPSAKTEAEAAGKPAMNVKSPIAPRQESDYAAFEAGRYPILLSHPHYPASMVSFAETDGRIIAFPYGRFLECSISKGNNRITVNLGECVVKISGKDIGGIYDALCQRRLLKIQTAGNVESVKIRFL